MNKLFRKIQSKRKKGFTLFEVLVVIVILGVLTAISIPTYNKVIKKGRVSDALHVLDMLAGAQDKYFIEHGHYAAYLTELKAPFKETRIPQSGHEFRDIVTTNFTYNKNYRRHCIEATSNINGENYTLVKNYKTKDKVVCRGPDCSNVADYVGDDIGDSAFQLLCPDEVTCNLTQADCGNKHFFWDTCECACTEESYQQCVSMGGTYSQSTCSCITGPCEDGQTMAPYYGDDCVYTGGDHTCGIQYITPTCVNSSWTYPFECVSKEIYCHSLGMILDPNTCECIPGESPCSGDQPAPQEGACGSTTYTCEQDANGNWVWVKSFIPLQGTDYQCDPNLTPTRPCPENPELVQVCGENCMWGDCQEQHCTDDQPASQEGACGSTTYTCEQDVNGNWVWTGHSILFEGNECQNGDTTTEGCPEGQQKTCVDCHWSDCGSGSGCDPNNKLTPGQTDVNGNTNIRACHIKDGIEDEDKFCGTETTNKQECDENGNWYWDFTDVECANVQEKPDSPPQTGSGSYLCYAHEGIRECTLSGNQYYWNQTGWTDWHLKAGANCGTIGQILGGTENFPIFCSEFCKAAKCKLPYFYNAKLKACYSHQTKVAVIATVVPATPATSNATGEVKKWAICGPIEQGTNYNGSNCLRTCKTVDEYTIKTTVFDNGEDYCYNTDDQGIAVDIENIPETVHPCTYNWPYTKVWNKGKQYTAYKCLRGGVANYQFVSYP